LAKEPAELSGHVSFSPNTLAGRGGYHSFCRFWPGLRPKGHIFGQGPHRHGPNLLKKIFSADFRAYTVHDSQPRDLVRKNQIYLKIKNFSSAFWIVGYAPSAMFGAFSPSPCSMPHALCSKSLPLATHAFRSFKLLFDMYIHFCYHALTLGHFVNLFPGL
jgi:hypothetical protein